MKNIIYFFGIFFVLSGQSFAAQQEAQSVAVCKNQVAVEVNGLVCDFCARAIEKVFRKKEEVANIGVNLDAGKISITMNDNQSIDDETLTQLITDSGYDVVKINRGCSE